MRTRRTVLAGLVAGLAGCGTSEEKTPIPGEPTQPAATTNVWYTHAQASGNRTLAGTVDLNEEPVEFEPAGSPQWLVARSAAEGSYWTVATADGRVSEWHVAAGSANRQREFSSLPATTQPVVRQGPSGTSLLDPPGELAPRASPVITPQTPDFPSKLLYMAGDGSLVVAGSETVRLPVDGLPDGRLASVGGGRYALFGDATDRYRHGALGDSIEGETLYVVDAHSADIVSQATLDPPVVFEGLQPLVADLDGDGRPEIVTTVADEADGARIRIFTPSGRRLATGPIHEPGWRHQLTVAPFGPDGGVELAVVRKPHVDRVVEFYRLDEGELEAVATTDGFSTHAYGSRILDGAVAGRFGTDGATTLLVPTTSREGLARVRRERGRATVGWRYRLDGPVTSNLTGVTHPDGGGAVGVATESTVSVWQS